MKCDEFREGIRDAIRRGGTDAAAQHRRECPECAAVWAREQALCEALDDLADRERFAAPGPPTEAAVMAAFRTRRRHRSPVRTRWAMAASGIAAAVALLWLGGWSRRPAAPVAAETAPAHGAFYALRDGPVLEQGEFAPIVRTRLPVRELRRFGLPLTPIHAEGVEVDIVVGRDGMAKAVRLVNSGTVYQKQRSIE